MKPKTKVTLFASIVVVVCVAMVAIAVFVLLIARDNPIASAKAEERERQARLAELAQNSKHLACVFVADRLSDQALLSDMAKNSSNLLARVFAAEKLGDEALIKESWNQLYKLRRDRERKEEEIKRVIMTIEYTDNQTFLREVLEKTPSTNGWEVVRQAAEKRLDELTK